MTTWRLFYENGFPSNAVTGATIVDVQRAAAGTLSIQTGPVFTSSSGVRGFGIGDGRNLTYRPTSALRGVVGLDVLLEVAFLSLIQGQPIGLFSTDTVSAVVTPTAPPAADGRTSCTLAITVAGQSTSVAALTFRGRAGLQPLERRRLQVRWTTNGQLHVFLDGQLVAYEPAASPGVSFNLTRWSLGDVDRPMTAVLFAAITHARVVELREDSAIDSLGEALDPEQLPEIDARCVKVAQATVQQHLRAARALMARFNQSRTAPWRAADGGSPFTPAAVLVHEAGGRAGVALNRYLQDGTDASRDEVVSHLRKVLTALASDQPEAFKALWTSLTQASTQYDCQLSAAKIRESNPELVNKLDALRDAVGDIVAGLGA